MPRSAPFQPKRKVDAVGSSRNRFIDREKPIHGQNFFTLGKNGMALVIERDDEILVYDNTFTVESEPDNPLFLYHSRQYLELVTSTDPLVNLRLVFLAHQLPRGSEFANLVGPLRARYMIDTYLIPHETICVHEDDDVVFGLSGTLDRVCQGLREFLLITVPRPDEDSLWELCILVPSRVLHLLTGPGDSLQEDSPIRVTKHGPVESSIPRLMEAKTRSYGPISNARQESIITMASSSLDMIISAINFVGQILLENDDPHESCHEYYRGGQPSVIPTDRLNETKDL
ncbi:hypothetical protein BGZ58_008772 [Dissophora ornata]|nr:hypothetical protein BGZ58_008772 [Dissophora ornata]